MGSIVFNGGTPINDYYPGVNFNGTNIEEVYFNGTKIWTRYPYPPGTEIFTFSWSPGNNIDSFRTSYYSNYPLVFASQPYYTQGGGNPDSSLRFTVNSGFQVSYYSQAEYGVDSNGSGPGNTGGTYSIYVGNTVTGASDLTYGFSLPGSGNGGSTIKVSYYGN